jgi:hypothetical protein
LLLALWGLGPDGEFVADVALAAAVIEPHSVEVITYPDDAWAIVVVDTAPAGGLYPPGTLFVDNWDAIKHLEGADPEDYAARVLTLTPSEPGNQIVRGTFGVNGVSQLVWAELNASGQLVSFVDPITNRWITPLNADDQGIFTLFTQQEIGQQGTRIEGDSVWWTNGGGQPFEIRTAPNGQAIAEYLAANPSHTLRERDGQLVLTDGDTILFTLTNATTGEWEQAVNPAEAFYTQAQALYGERYGINLDPNVEVHPNGRMTIYSIVNGQRVETVRTAINEDGSLYLDENGHPVALFAPEAIALAESIPLQGGNLADRIHISYMPDVPRLPSGQFIILDQARVRAQVEAVLNVRSGLPVQNVLSADQLTKNHLLTDESGTVRIERVNVVLGRIRNQLPGYRPMYTNFTPTGPGSGRNESYGYIWNPDQPEKITIMIYLDDSIFTNRNTDFQYRNSLLLGSMLKGIALLQSRSRPVFNFPKAGIDVFSDLNSVGTDFRWLSVENPAEGWYRAVDYHVSDD